MKTILDITIKRFLNINKILNPISLLTDAADNLWLVEANRQMSTNKSF